MECCQSYYIHNQSIRPCAEFDEHIFLARSSVYEVIRTEQGVALFTEDHLERLLNSVQIMGLSLFTQREDIKKSIQKLLDINQVTTGKIKILVNFDPDTKKQTDFFIYFNPHYFPTEDEYINGVKVGLCQAIRNNPNAKVLNTDARIRANHAIAEKKLFEVILIDNDGCLTEGSRSNLLFIKGNTVFSAPEQYILQGIARKNVKRVCTENNISFIENKIKLDDAGSMDAMFLTGTSLKILPVSGFESYIFSTDNTLMKKLMFLYDREIEKYIRNGF